MFRFFNVQSTIKTYVFYTLFFSFQLNISCSLAVQTLFFFFSNDNTTIFCIFLEPSMYRSRNSVRIKWRTTRVKFALPRASSDDLLHVILQFE